MYLNSTSYSIRDIWDELLRFDIPPVDSENPPFKWSDEVFPVALPSIHRPEQKNTEKTSETPKSQLYPNIKI